MRLLGVIAVVVAAYSLALAHAQSGSDDSAERMAKDYILDHYGALVPDPDRLEVELVGRLPGRPLELLQLAMGETMNRFIAVYSTTRGLARVGGAAQAFMSVPAPNRRITSGELLTNDDLSDVTVDAFSLDQEIALSRNAVVGHEARRALSPGRPIRADFLDSPTVIEVNQAVEMLFQAPGLRITVKGRAVDEGGVGDTIRVMNVRSNKIVTGVVVDASTVTVMF